MVCSRRFLSALATVAVAGFAAAPTAHADGGLKLPSNLGGWGPAAITQTWPLSLHFSAVLVDLQPRGPAATALGWPDTRATGGMSLIGDYYFQRAPAADGSSPSGLRATGGLLLRQPGLAYSDLTLSARGLRDTGGALLPAGVAADGYSAKPYLGLGYSGSAPRLGLGYWIDLGVVVQSPGNALGIGRALSGSQGAYDLLRDLQLAPMVQVGVSYAF